MARLGGTLLDIPLLHERYRGSLAASAGLHIALVLFFAVAPYLLPKRAPIIIGSGFGGGVGAATETVGIVDELAGGTGLFKPSLTPQAPALPAQKAEKPVPEPIPEKAVALPETVEKKAPKKVETATGPTAREAIPQPKTNVVPTAAEPGAGGSGGVTGGSGGGRGGGMGVSIGAGTGGFGDSYYARTVEMRVGSNWIKPMFEGVRIEITYSFVITTTGQITDVRKVKSSGNEVLDLTAERAIRASNPLPKPPPEFGGRPIQFMAQFIYPPGSQ